MDGKIRLTDALNLMDEKTVGDRVQSFSVAWVAANGEIITLNEAMKCGLKPGIDRNRYIGLRSINNSHHATTVEIHTILHFNNQRVYW